MKELRFFLSPSTVCFFVCFFEGVGSGVGRAQASKASPNVVCTVGVLPAFSHISGPYFPGGFLSILLAPPPPGHSLCLSHAPASAPQSGASSGKVFSGSPN